MDLIRHQLFELEWVQVNIQLSSWRIECWIYDEVLLKLRSQIYRNGLNWSQFRHDSWILPTYWPINSERTFRANLPRNQPTCLRPRLRVRKHGPKTQILREAWFDPLILNINKFLDLNTPKDTNYIDWLIYGILNHIQLIRQIIRFSCSVENCK